jgi:cytochrome c oxidase subunit 2
MGELLRQLGMPLDGSAHGPAIDSMMGLVHWLMLALFVGWGIYFVYSLARFRQKKNPTANYHGTKTKLSTYAEVGVAVIEVVLIVGFAVPLWSQRVDDFPPAKESTVVRVVAEQFAWNTHYPGPDGVFGRTDIKLVSGDNPLGLDRSDPNAKDDIFTVNNLNLPVGKPAIVYLSSKDVIHSFGLPLFRVKQDAIPGEVIPVWFVPTKTTDQLREEMSWFMSTDGVLRGTELVVMDDYRNRNGEILASKGDFLSDNLLASLRESGIERLKVSQDTPTEVACAQLCGLGHFRMRGSITIMSAEDYQAWLVEEASYLQTDDDDSTE